MSTVKHRPNTILILAFIFNIVVQKSITFVIIIIIIKQEMAKLRLLSSEN